MVSPQHSQHSLSDVLSSSCLHHTKLQETIQREVDRYKQSHIRCGTAYGELDHPSYYSITFRDLHMATVSHQVICASQSASFLQCSSWFKHILHACFLLFNTAAIGIYERCCSKAIAWSSALQAAPSKAVPKLRPPWLAQENA